MPYIKDDRAPFRLDDSDLDADSREASVVCVDSEPNAKVPATSDAVLAMLEFPTLVLALVVAEAEAEGDEEGEEREVEVLTD